MLATAIVISSLILLALLRFGAIVEYSDAGFESWLKVGFLKIRIGGKGDSDWLDLVAKIFKKSKKKKPKEKKPGDFQTFLNAIKAVKKALDRLRRRLLIKRLTLYYTSASDDPSKTAIGFGTANAVFATIIPVLERYFRIKKRDLRVFADYEEEKPRIYTKIIISLAVWEVIYMAAALLPIVTASFTRKAKSRKNTSDVTDRKDGHKDGESTNKRFDGNHDAKDKGDD